MDEPSTAVIDRSELEDVLATECARNRGRSYPDKVAILVETGNRCFERHGPAIWRGNTDENSATDADLTFDLRDKCIPFGPLLDVRQDCLYTVCRCVYFDFGEEFSHRLLLVVFTDPNKMDREGEKARLPVNCGRICADGLTAGSDHLNWATHDR